MTRLVLRAALLFVALALLFPEVLGGIAGGAWPRLVNAMGTWRWLAWGTCFVTLLVVGYGRGWRRGG